MALPGSGQIKLSEIQSQFQRGGANPVSLSEYYKGGASGYVKTTDGSVGNIPPSGTIKMSNFYNSYPINGVIKYMNSNWVMSDTVGAGWLVDYTYGPLYWSGYYPDVNKTITKVEISHHLPFYWTLGAYVLVTANLTENGNDIQWLGDYSTTIDDEDYWSFVWNGSRTLVAGRAYGIRYGFDAEVYIEMDAGVVTFT